MVRDDVAVPVPPADEVLIEVTAAAVNNTDIWTREGAYGTREDTEAIAGWRGVPLEFPRIQGGDIAGRIVATGSGVDPGRIHQRVVVDPGLYASPDPDATPVGVLGSERDGGFAQYVTVQAAAAHDVSESPLDDAQLACLPIAYGTAMGMLERAAIAPGEKLLVTGASGGVGLALVQLAATRNMTVIALTSIAKADAVLAAGATGVVTRNASDLAARILDTAGGELDAIADVVGADIFTTTFPLLRDGGRLVTAGAIAGPVVSFDLRALYLRHRLLIGSTMHTPAQFQLLVSQAREGKIAPQVAATYPLVEIHRAQRDFLAKGFVGKLVLIP